jgi:hypothetical protein
MGDNRRELKKLYDTLSIRHGELLKEAEQLRTMAKNGLAGNWPVSSSELIRFPDSYHHSSRTHAGRRQYTHARCGNESASPRATGRNHCLYVPSPIFDRAQTDAPNRMKRTKSLTYCATSSKFKDVNSRTSIGASGSSKRKGTAQCEKCWKRKKMRRHIGKVWKLFVRLIDAALVMTDS